MISRQARDLASKGHNVLVADLYGTGDSEGEFSEASWSLWKNDLYFLMQWIREQGSESAVLWGIRTGCLLALETLNDLNQCGPVTVEQLVLWQPVVSGQNFLKQFLRLKVAAAMMEGEKLAVNDLLSASRQGDSIEIAGYGLSPALIEQISAASMKNLEVPAATHVHWIEVASSEGKSLSPAAKGVTSSWIDNGVEVSCQVVLGEPFWSTQEIAMAPALVSVTTDLMSGACDGAAFLEKVSGVTGFLESPVTFRCHSDELVGVLHQASGKSGKVKRGVLLVVGGPQYRVGSHRQFVLLARHLAKEGIPVFRFDYRGMGDSGGQLLGFEHVQDDIAAAMDCFQQLSPELDEFAIWGLCDAATAASFYAYTDARVKGLVLLNPWAYSEQGEAKAFLKYYYLQRFFSKAFWLKVLRGEFRPKESLDSLGDNLNKIQSAGAEEKGSQESAGGGNLGGQILSGLKKFSGRSLIILSGKDLTAAQFKDAVGDSREFKKLLEKDRFSLSHMSDADHTFSSRGWRDEVARRTFSWLRED